jgi:hypothetical protein
VFENALIDQRDLRGRRGWDLRSRESWRIKGSWQKSPVEFFSLAWEVGGNDAYEVLRLIMLTEKVIPSAEELAKIVALAVDSLHLVEEFSPQGGLIAVA